MCFRIPVIIIFSILAFFIIIPAINTSGLFNSAFALNDVVTEGDCRMCHCYNVPDTHHQLVAAGRYECLDCHQIKWDEVSQGYYTELIRDCVICHSNVVGDTHHLLVEAKRYECLDCHQMTWDEISQNYFVELNLSCFNAPQISNQAPVADAGPDQTVSAGQLVNFSGEGSYDPDGIITNYGWYLGDGSAGTGITIDNTYTTPGTYTVTLSVTDDKGTVGTDTAVITVLEVAVNQPPVADAGPNQLVRTGEQVNFSAEMSSDNDGYILSYAWDFGDGSTGTGIKTSHIYDNPGSYTVALNVTDDKGAVDTDITAVKVKRGSKSNRVYADEVLRTNTTNVTDPDDSGTGEDITIKFLNAGSDSYFDIASQGNSAEVISMRVNIEPGILSNVNIRLYVKGFSGNNLQEVRVYPYNFDGKSIKPDSYLDFHISNSGFADLDVTPISHTMNGYGWMKFRIVSSSGRVRISKGNFVLK
jgi:PKD repeat protein